MLLFTLNRDEDGCIWIQSRKQAFSVSATETIEYSYTDLNMVFYSLLGKGHVTRACRRREVLKEEIMKQNFRKMFLRNHSEIFFRRTTYILTVLLAFLHKENDMYLSHSLKEFCLSLSSRNVNSLTDKRSGIDCVIDNSATG